MQRQSTMSTAVAARSPLNRSPVLIEVLKRTTKPPVDLYCYYLFLQRESSEDVLDFWLDVQQHENLCRAYFNDLRKQSVRVSNDWPRYYHYAKVHGSIYGKATGIHQGDADDDEDQDEDEGARGHDLLSGGIEKEWRGGQQSGYAEKIDQDDDDEDGRHQQQQRHPRGTTSEDSSNFNNSNNNTQDNYLSTPDQQADPRSTMRTPSPTFNGPSSAYPLSPTLRAMYPHDADDHLDHHPSDDRPRPSSRRSNSNSHKRVPSRQQQQPLQPYIPRSTAINRTDLIASAERIYSRYLLPGSAKEVYLPTSLRIESFPISSSTLPSVHHPSYDVEADAQARVPDMFHRQKEFVYQQMARDSFPRFVRAKVWGNLTSTSSLIRLIGGLFALWAGLATAFSFIFLDVAPRSTRLWVILPFTVAIFNILAHIWDLDVVLVFMGLSEISTFHTITIREPYVRRLLFGRALWITFFASIIVAALTVLFYFVPGHRL